MNRYARQIILPEIGAKGQARLSAAHLLVVGAGGLGCPVLQYLGGAGVGKITLLDPDCVQEHNLHRQTIFTMHDIGKPKALAAKAHLEAAFPDVEIVALPVALEPSNARMLVQKADLVIDAGDMYALSYILSDNCLAEKTPFISASALGQTGYAGAFCASAPSLRALFPEVPTDGASCESAGVMGPVVGMIGAMQAQMALKILLDHQPSPLGRLVRVDMKNLTFTDFSFLDAREPETFFPFLSVCDIRDGDQLFDLRGALEAPKMFSPRAERLTVEALEALVPNRDDGGRVIFGCASGLRAWRAAACLQARGYERLAILAAGRGR